MMHMCCVISVLSMILVYRDHKHQNSDELDVTKGDEAGLVDKDNFDVYWKVKDFVVAIYLFVLAIKGKLIVIRKYVKTRFSQHHCACILTLQRTMTKILVSCMTHHFFTAHFVTFRPCFEVTILYHNDCRRFITKAELVLCLVAALNIQLKVTHSSTMILKYKTFMVLLQWSGIMKRRKMMKFLSSKEIL